MKSTSNFNNLPLISLVLASLLTLSACKDKDTLLVKDSSPSIPSARLGLNGEYDSSGLAKRVAQALEKDSMLTDVSSVYVAQTESKIILKGTVSNQTFLDRIVTVARNVSGVTEVDASQVEIR